MPVRLSQQDKGMEISVTSFEGTKITEIKTLLNDDDIQVMTEYLVQYLMEKKKKGVMIFTRETGVKDDGNS